MKHLFRVITTVTIVGLAATGLAYLYLNIKHVNLENNNKSIEILHQINQISTQENLEILRISTGLSKDYSQLDHYDKEISNTINNLPTDLQSKNLKALLTEKTELITQFKSDSTLLNKTLKDLDRVFNKSINNPEVMNSEFNVLITKLFTATANYNQTGNDVNLREISTNSTQLRRVISNAPLTSETIRELNTLTDLINLMIAKRSTINMILDKITVLPLQRQLNASISLIQANSSSQLELQKDYTNYLTYYALALFFVFLFIAIRLLYSYAHLNTLNKNLETEVANRTQDLQIALDELKKSEMILIHSEKMSALGQLVAGVAHEINTPLAYTKNALSLIQSNIKDFNLKNFIDLGEAFIKYMNAPNGDEKQKQQKIVQNRYQIMLLTLKKLGVEGFRYHDLLEETNSLLTDGITGTDKISDLIINLRNFSRLDRGEVSRYSLKEAINSTLTLLRYEIKNKDISVIAEEDLVIECIPSQINQVLLNIVNNANQAIKKDGKITITLFKDKDDYNCISIKDNGTGIAKENLKNIFNPFFTTKEVGKGTGLGLPISYKIVQDHSGDIVVNSTIGKGTEFLIKLPFDNKLSTIFF